MDHHNEICTITGEKMYSGLIYQILNSVCFVLCSYGIHYFMGNTMSSGEYGTMGIILVILDFEYLFVNNGVRQAVSREIASKKYDDRDLLLKSIFFQCVLTGILFLINIGGARYLGEVFHDSTLQYYIKIAAFIVPATGLYIITQGIHNGLFLFRRESIIGIIYSVLKLSIIPYSYFLKENSVVAAEFGFFTAALGSLIAGGVSIWQKKEQLSKRTKKASILAFAKCSLNYSLFFIIVSVILSMDTLILRYYTLDPSVVGYYTGAVNFGKITYYLLTAFFLIALPIIVDLYIHNNYKAIKETIKTLFLLILVFILPIPILIIATSEKLLSLFYSREYILAANALRFLSISDFLMGIIVVFNMIVTAMNKRRVSILLSLLMLTADIFLCCTLTKRIGMTGTAAAGLICTGIISVILFIYVTSIVGIFINKQLVTAFILSVLYGCIMWRFFHYFPFTNIVSLVFAYFVAYLLYIGIMFIFKILDIQIIFQFLQIKRKIKH